jgi:hypothetical protein
VRSKALGFFICRAANASQNILQVRQFSACFWTGVEKRQSLAQLPIYQHSLGKFLPTPLSRSQK